MIIRYVRSLGPDPEDEGNLSDDLTYKEMAAQAERDTAALKREQSQIISEMNLWQNLINESEEASEQLLAENEDTMNKFHTLNEYAKACVADKLYLEGQARILNKIQVNNCRQAAKTLSTYVITEASTGDLYRGQIYRYIYGLQDTDQFDIAIASVRECEESLGKFVSGPQEATRLLEPSLLVDENCKNDSDEEENEYDLDAQEDYQTTSLSRYSMFVKRGM